MKRSPIIALLILSIVVVGSGATYLWLVNKSNVFKTSPTGNAFSAAMLSQFKAKPPELPKVASKLDGILVSPDFATRHPLGVMIENHPDARPQSGLSSASVVYEAIAEGGITRFLALFGSRNAAKVGPIRSARTYYADWCNEFDCYYAHVGGNYDALYEKIPQDRIKDLDEFANGASYHREPKAGLATEHTMYSDTATLYKLANTKKWSTAVRNDYGIYTFMDNPKSSSTSPVHAINKIAIHFSTPQFLVEYTYDISTNSYKRNLAGKPHLDANGQTPITAKNIVIQNITRTDVVTQINEPGFAMPTVGSGKATIYQGGTKIEATWTKTNKYQRTEFLDASGNLIKLYPGATWVEIVNPGSTVSDS